jgi:hypothetical protein
MWVGQATLRRRQQRGGIPPEEIDMNEDTQVAGVIIQDGAGSEVAGVITQDATGEDVSMWDLDLQPCL